MTFSDLAADFVKPYKIDEKMINQALELKHGKSVRVFPMDKVSNGNFSSVRLLSLEQDRTYKPLWSERV
jgi:hypothetical protein